MACPSDDGPPPILVSDSDSLSSWDDDSDNDEKWGPSHPMVAPVYRHQRDLLSILMTEARNHMYFPDFSPLGTIHIPVQSNSGKFCFKILY